MPIHFLGFRLVNVGWAASPALWGTNSVTEPESRSNYMFHRVKGHNNLQYPQILLSS